MISPLMTKKRMSRRDIANQDIGKRFGSLVMLSYQGVSGQSTMCKYKCDCGAIDTCNMYQVRKGAVTKCKACAYTYGRAKVKTISTDKKYGKLTPVQFSHRFQDKSYWLFNCDCGKMDCLVDSAVARGSVTCCDFCNPEIDPETLTEGANLKIAERNTGKRYGFLISTGFHKRMLGNTYYSYDCDCGRKTIKHNAYVHTMRTTSCGHPDCNVKQRTAKFN